MIRGLPPVDLTSAAGIAAAEGRPDVRVLEVPLAALASGETIPGGPDEPLTWLRVRPEPSGAPPSRRAWPADEDFAALPSGVIGMTLDAPSLPGAPQLIAFLVRATSFGVPLEWGGAVAGLPCGLLFHLAPPAFGDDAAAKWRAAHRYGQCYWRRGNGFATVQDLREEPGAHFVIHDPGLLALFHRLADPVATAGLGEQDRARLGDLLDARLAVEIGGVAVALPYRLRRWPAPVIDF
ncbi:hypothetical protein AGRA3207_004485 [Actinomadura graeca]|uniref:DUF1963 domain-containing protein n=1 Tax=Actinomadura graeca TaxID=2750812 RepID=A0ABX8QXJ6_9ACTN|nr:DUF5825 family protein [Actinomadura graeca]QXJ23343.1 hypothetical protein AGRA3207_004485 [Actinomadura graeca]